MSALEIQSVEIVGGHDASVPRVRTRAKSRTVPIAEIERDPEINCRSGGVNEKLAVEYSDALKAGAKFPAVIVFRDESGKRWLADGFHRARAHEIAGIDEIAVDERQGDRRAALLYAAGANAGHGARRTNADKRRAVAALLADLEWAAWSDQIIGERCGVSQPFVSSLRRSTQNGSESKARRGKDGKLRRAPKRKGKASRTDRAEREAGKAIERGLAELTRRHARKRLPVLYTKARAWISELEAKHAGMAGA